jgi:hypothetical protein
MARLRCVALSPFCLLYDSKHLVVAHLAVCVDPLRPGLETVRLIECVELWTVVFSFDHYEFAADTAFDHA